jgi:hypothetical protein
MVLLTKPGSVVNVLFLFLESLPSKMLDRSNDVSEALPQTHYCVCNRGSQAAPRNPTDYPGLSGRSDFLDHLGFSDRKVKTSCHTAACTIADGKTKHILAGKIGEENFTICASI